MKQTSLIFNIVLSAAVVVLFILHFTSKPAEAPATPAASQNSTETIAVSSDIAYIQIDSLVNQYDMFNDLRTDLQGKMERIQGDIERKGMALKKDYEDFGDRYRKGLMTSSQAEKTQQQLMQREQDFNAYTQQKNMELAEEEQVLYNRVLDALKTYLNKYNASGKYAMILTTSNATNVIMNGSKSLDITQDVLKGLNEEYIQSKKSK